MGLAEWDLAARSHVTEYERVRLERRVYAQKNPPESKMVQLHDGTMIEVESDYIDFDGRGFETRDEALRREWAELIGLYNVMMANRPSVRTNAAQAELHRHAVARLSSKLMEHEIGPLSRILAIGNADPAKLIEALKPKRISYEREHSFVEITERDPRYGPRVTARAPGKTELVRYSYEYDDLSGDGYLVVVKP
jgi:hypothetical protein